MHTKRLFGILALGLGLTLALLVGLHTAQAAPTATDWFVTATGSGSACSQVAPCDLQVALNQATDGDTIYVAEGVYTGTGAAVITITQSTTIYGGWDGAASGAIARNPAAYPTTLDGEWARRVVHISGNITPTLDGFIVTRGNASAASGGGIYVITATVTISGCQIHNNMADQNGGGISLQRNTRATLAGNRVYSNTAGWSGGGVSLSSESDDAELTGNYVFSNTANSGGGINVDSSDNAQLTGNRVFSNTTRLSDGGGIQLYKSNYATLTDNQIYSNTAVTYGGGVSLDSSPTATLASNIIMSNTVLTGTGRGGGIYLTGSPAAALTGNQVSYNTAAQNGGGLFIISSNSVALTGNQVLNNAAYVNGGGIFLWSSSTARLAGNRIYRNRVIGNGDGGGIFLLNSVNSTLVNNMVLENRLQGSVGAGAGIMANNNTRAHLLHTTLAGNSGGSGYAVRASTGTTLWMTNTIIASHTVGVSANSGNTITLNSTLWGSGVWANLTNWSGPGSITSTQNYTGNPAFVNPPGGEYHLGPGSAAIDAGVCTQITTDIDGDTRPIGPGCDIGADEWYFQVYLPLVLRSY
jgi:parallel beta-helix repeat protein